MLEREVRMNLAYRDFTRIGMGKVPDAKTLARIAQAPGGEVIAELHRRLVEMAQAEGVIQGRKLRVDTTLTPHPRFNFRIAERTFTIERIRSPTCFTAT